MFPLFHSIKRIVARNSTRIGSRYAAIAMAQQLVQMVCGFLVLRWVAPPEMGVWQAVILIDTYSQIIRLGIVNAMAREYPFLLGKGKKDEAVQYIQTTEAYTIIAALSELVIIIVVMAMFGRDLNFDWRLGFLTLILYAPLNLYRGFLESTFRGGREFGILARIHLWGIVLNCVTLLLPVYYGFTGFCIRVLVITGITTLLLWLWRPVREKPKLISKCLKYLIFAGIPLFISNYLTAFAAGFSRIILLHEGGAPLAGLFSPVVSIIALGSMVPATLSVYLLPKLNFNFGASGAAKVITKAAIKAGFFCCLVMLPFIAIGWWLLPLVMEKMAPLYIDIIPAMRIALILSLVNCFRLTTVTFSVLQAWKPMFINLLFLIVTSYTGPHLGLKLWPTNPIFGVTVGALFAGLIQIPISLACVNLAGKQAHARTEKDIVLLQPQ